MEGGESMYTPWLNCKVLDKTSCKVIAIIPLEYVIFTGTNSWRDVALLGSKPEEAPLCILKDYPIDGNLWE